MAEPAGWGFWPLLVLLGMVLAMDENSLAQTWLSQPLPAGILAGCLAGDPATGALLGVLMQLVVIGNFPVGASFCLDTGSAVLGVSLVFLFSPLALITRFYGTLAMPAAAELDGVLRQSDMLLRREDGTLWVQSSAHRWRAGQGLFTSFDVYDREGRFVQRVDNAVIG